MLLFTLASGIRGCHSASPITICGGGAVAQYRSLVKRVDERTAAHGIARWLSDPLSVTSPASSDGCSSRTASRVTRVALPVAVAANDVRSSRSRPVTAGCLTTSSVGAGARSGAERPAGLDVRHAEHADFVAVVAGNHRVAHVWRKVRDEPRPQRPDADPGAGRELEILFDPAVEDQPLGQSRAIDGAHGVAHAVEALVVERRAREVVLAPVAGRHVRTADAHLELLARRRELGVDARHRQSDRGRLIARPRPADRHRRGLRGAEPGDENQPLTARFDRDRLQLVRQVLRQARGGVEQDLHPREERLRQCRILPERAHELFVAFRDVEIDRRRDFLEVAHRLRECRRQRPPVIDVERAAVVDDDADVVVAAERVVPWQPVDQHRRLLAEQRQRLQDHLLVAADHPMRVDDALGRPGRARREQDLRDVVRTRSRRGGVPRSAVGRERASRSGRRHACTISTRDATPRRLPGRNAADRRRRRGRASAGRRRGAARRSRWRRANTPARSARTGCRRAAPRAPAAGARRRCPKGWPAAGPPTGRDR